MISNTTLLGIYMSKQTEPQTKKQKLTKNKNIWKKEEKSENYGQTINVEFTT